MTTRPSKDTVGSYFVDEYGLMWQQVSFTDKPTASFQSVQYPGSSRLDGVIGSPILESLRILTPEPK